MIRPYFISVDVSVGGNLEGKFVGLLVESTVSDSPGRIDMVEIMPVNLLATLMSTYNPLQLYVTPFLLSWRHQLQYQYDFVKVYTADIVDPFVLRSYLVYCSRSCFK